MPTNSNSSAAAGDTWSTAADVGSGGGATIVSAETATGSHELKVEGYSRHKGRRNGKAIFSGKFRIGGHRWSISYFPGGFGKKNGKWISFGLCLHPSATDGGDVKAEFTISILHKDGQPLPEYTRGGYPCIFSSKENLWILDQFIAMEDMDSLCLKDDCFCIRCVVAVDLDTRQEFVVPPPDLHQHLGDLLASGVGGDVAFDVGGETFTAHKNVLAARSPVFMAQFFGCPMKENVATRVAVHGIEPSVFKAMLHFIYTDSLPAIKGGDNKIVTAQHLLVAADRYNIERLKSICENVLRVYVSTSVVVTTLVLAEQHGCPRLKEACFKILKSYDNNREVLVRADLEHLASSCPSLLDELREAGLCRLFENMELITSKKRTWN